MTEVRRLPTRDGLELVRQRWLPSAGAPGRGVVVIVHGVAEHAGRYGPLADDLNAAGWIVESYDQRGWGRSSGRPCSIDRFDQYLDDLRALADAVAAEHRSLPLVLYGHSMGGLIALAAGIRQPAPWVGVVASAPALGLAMRPSPLKLAAVPVLHALLPHLALPNDIDASLLSHDESIARAYRTDPLVRNRVSARWFTEWRRTAEFVSANAARFRLPLLLLLAGDDRLVDNEPTRRFALDCGSTDVELREYPGFYHEVHNEVGRERVIADLLGWLAARVRA